MILAYINDTITDINDTNIVNHFIHPSIYLYLCPVGGMK